MTKEKMLRFYRIYRIALSISIIAAGICLIGGCLSIYYSGDQPYSRQAVADTFSVIALPVYLCLALTVVGFILEWLLPVNPKPQKSFIDYKKVIERLSKKKDLAECYENLISSIGRERKKRRLHSVIQLILLSISSLVFLTYALNGNNFDNSEINESVIKAMWVLIPCLAVPFGYAIFTAYHNEKSFLREIAIIKEIPATKNAYTADAESVADSAKKINLLRFALLFIGIAVLIYGFATGGVADVLTKAVNICTECIGLG